MVLSLLDVAVDHLIHNVLPAAADYEAAENALSLAYAEDPTPDRWEAAARLTKRRAAELAIAIDGLTDRSEIDLGGTKGQIRNLVAALCNWPGTSAGRPDCLERVRGVANAYKHANLNDPNLPISSEADVLVVSTGFGVDAYGAGKFGGVEVILRDKAGTSWKFLADAPVALVGWFRFLQAQGAALPSGPYKVCNLQVHP